MLVGRRGRGHMVGLTMNLHLEGRGLDGGKAATPILWLIHRRQRGMRARVMGVTLTRAPHLLMAVWTDVVLDRRNLAGILAGILGGGTLRRRLYGAVERRFPLPRGHVWDVIIGYGPVVALAIDKSGHTLMSFVAVLVA